LLLKSKIITDNNTLSKKAIPILSITILTESISLSGSIIASSYRKVATTEQIPTIEVNKASVPYSSGVYNLVKTGDINMGTACARAVPVIKVNMFLIKSVL
jgi:hypothetical protein